MSQPTETLGRKAGAQHPPSLDFKVELHSRRGCAPTPPNKTSGSARPEPRQHDPITTSSPAHGLAAPAHSKAFRPTFRSREGHGEAKVPREPHSPAPPKNKRSIQPPAGDRLQPRGRTTLPRIRHGAGTTPHPPGCSAPPERAAGPRSHWPPRDRCGQLTPVPGE